MSLFAYLTRIGTGSDGTQHNKHYYIGCFLRPTDQKWVVGKGWGAIGRKPNEKIITESVKHGAFVSEDQARAYVKATIKAETEKNGYKLEWQSGTLAAFSQVPLSDPSGQRDKPAWFAPEVQTPRTPVLKVPPTLAPASPAPAVAGPAPKALIPVPVSKSGAALIKAKADVIAANPPAALPEELPPEPEENKDGIFGRKPSLTVVWRD